MPDASLSIKIGADVSNAVGGFQKISQQLDATNLNIQQSADYLDRLSIAFDGMRAKGEDTSGIEANMEKLENRIRDLQQDATKTASALNTIPPAMSNITVGSDGLLNTLAKQRIAFQDVGRLATGEGFSLLALSRNFTLFSPAVVVAVGAIALLTKAFLAAEEQQKELDAANKKFLTDFGTPIPLNINLNEAKAQLQSYEKIITDVISTTSKEASQVDILVDRIQRGNLTRQQTVEAIKKLQQIAPDYFGKLDAERTSVEQVTNAYNNYNNALLKSIETQIKIAELNDIVKERLTAQQSNPQASKFIDDQLSSGKSLSDIQKQISQNITDQNKAFIQAAQANKIITDEMAKQVISSGQIPAGADVLLSYLQKEKDILDSIKNAAPEDIGIKPPNIDKLKAEQEQLQLIVKLQEELQKNNTEPLFERARTSIELQDNSSAQYKLVQDQISQAIQNGNRIGTANSAVYAQQIATLYKQLLEKNISDVGAHVNFDVQDASSSGNLSKTIDKIKEGIQKHLEDLKEVDVKVPVYIEDAVKDDSSLTDEQKRIILEKIKEDAGKGIPTILLPIPIKAQFKAVIDAAEAKKALQDINNAIDSSITGGLTNLGESIGSAIAKGKNPIEAAGDAIVSSLGEMIEKIGEALVKFGAIKLGLDAILKNPILIPGGVAIAIGIGAIAVGALLKSVANSGKGFASGGPISGPGGPTSDSILARLSNGEFVVKAAAVRQPGNLALLNAINEGQTPAFASGGFVGPDLSFPNSPLNSFVQNNVISFDKIPVEITGKSKIEGNHIIIAHTRATKNQNLVS